MENTVFESRRVRSRAGTPPSATSDLPTVVAGPAAATPAIGDVGLAGLVEDVSSVGTKASIPCRFRRATRLSATGGGVRVRLDADRDHNQEEVEVPACHFLPLNADGPHAVGEPVVWLETGFRDASQYRLCRVAGGSPDEGYELRLARAPASDPRSLAAPPRRRIDGRTRLAAMDQRTDASRGVGSLDGVGPRRDGSARRGTPRVAGTPAASRRGRRKSSAAASSRGRASRASRRAPRPSRARGASRATATTRAASGRALFEASTATALPSRSTATPGPRGPSRST